MSLKGKVTINELSDLCIRLGEHGVEGMGDPHWPIPHMVTNLTATIIGVVNTARVLGAQHQRVVRATKRANAKIVGP